MQAQGSREALAFRDAAPAFLSFTDANGRPGRHPPGWSPGASWPVRATYSE